LALEFVKYGRCKEFSVWTLFLFSKSRGQLMLRQKKEDATTLYTPKLQILYNLARFVGDFEDHDYIFSKHLFLLKIKLNLILIS